MNDIDTFRKKSLKLDSAQMDQVQAEKPFDKVQFEKPATLSASRSKLQLYMVSETQLDTIVTYRNGLEGQLLWAAPGVLLGSATGAISALLTFVAHKTLSVEGFVENILFFASAFVTLTLLTVIWPKRNVFRKTVDLIRSSRVNE